MELPIILSMKFRIILAMWLPIIFRDYRSTELSSGSNDLEAWTIHYPLWHLK